MYDFFYPANRNIQTSCLKYWWCLSIISFFDFLYSDPNTFRESRLDDIRDADKRVQQKSVTLFLFYKNHVFQNEAGLFLIFSKIWGSIVLNLFLNYILKNDNEKINRK